jgi:cobalt-zinc-cadmium efflux system outer membrane protein
MPKPSSAHGLLALALALLPGSHAWAAPGSGEQAESPAPRRQHAHEPGPALSFDDSLGAAAGTPLVVGLDEAATDKRKLDAAIPKVVLGPEVQVYAGGRVIPEDIRGVEVQITATQSWSLGHYAGKRREAAEAESDLLDARARAQALDQRLAAAHAWIRLHAAEQQLALAQDELALAQELSATLELALREGVGTRADVADARARAAVAEQLVIDWTGQVHDLGLELARETGADGRTPLRTRGDYPDPQLPSEDELRRRFEQVDGLPKVAVAKLAARAQRAAAAEAKSARASWMNAGFSFQRESGTDIVIFGVVGAAIGIDKGERERGTALAAAREAEATAESNALALTATLTIALHDLHHTHQRMVVLRDHTLPAHDELVAARQVALEQGEGTLALLLDARARRSAVARELAQASADEVWARVMVWLYLAAFEEAAEAPLVEEDAR